MKTAVFKQYFKKLTAAAMILWLSGLILVVCCENLSATEKKDSCPLAKTSHCAAKADMEESSASLSTTQDFQGLGCCLMPNIFDKARKIESNFQAGPAEILPVEIQSAKLLPLKTKSAAATFYHPPLDVKNRTYLKNRVLRI